RVGRAHSGQKRTVVNASTSPCNNSVHRSPKSVVKWAGGERRTPLGCASHNPFGIAIAIVLAVG
ncbi:MAG: hypothetical protein SFY66_00880, partial [Oculatellaceae cyanobacterium bins.114]|nr:hypothetical protein [Oculatellaceae cyanobacterium bins.114]